MSDIRSAQLALVNVALVNGASSDLYTVPAGFVTLLYTVTLFNRATGAVPELRLAIRPSGGSNLYVAAIGGGATLTSVLYQGRLVLNAGDTVRVRAGGTGSVDMGLFGQELEVLP